MIRQTYKTALLFSAIRVAFDGNKAGWKLDDAGNVVVQNGNPVWVDANGQEGTIAIDTISRLNGEAKAHRERAEKAETALKAFEGLDPSAARSALDTVSKLDQKALVDAGQVDQVRNEVKSQYETLLAEKDTALNSTLTRLNDTLLANAFGSSKFVQEKISVPAEMFQATFARNFKVEDGKVLAVGADGKPIYSKSRIGEVADFDEAVSILVEGYSHKDAILKAPSKGGSGNDGKGGERGGDVRFVKRGDFASMAPGEQASLAAKARAGEVQIVD